MQIELPHQVVLMGVHRLDAEIEATGDVLQRNPLGQQDEDLPLAIAQQIVAALVFRRMRDVLADHARQDPGAHVLLPPVDGLNGVNQLHWRRVL